MDVAEIGDVGEERGLLDLEMSCCACVGKRGNIRRSSAALEWDEAQQKVVAQRMQVGLSIHQPSLSAAQESSSCYNKRTGLVDTIVVPEELAELKDLTSILSLERMRDKTCVNTSPKLLTQKLRSAHCSMDNTCFRKALFLSGVLLFVMVPCTQMF